MSACLVQEMGFCNLPAFDVLLIAIQLGVFAACLSLSLVYRIAEKFGRNKTWSLQRVVVHLLNVQHVESFCHFHTHTCTHTPIHGYMYAHTHRVSNPTLLLALGFCGAAWWFIAIKNKSENIKILGRSYKVWYCM